MELHCPKCNKLIMYQQKDSTKGTHHEHVGPHCTEFLQWASPLLIRRRAPLVLNPRKRASIRHLSLDAKPTGLVPYFR